MRVSEEIGRAHTSRDQQRPARRLRVRIRCWGGPDGCPDGETTKREQRDEQRGNPKFRGVAEMRLSCPIVLDSGAGREPSFDRQRRRKAMGKSKNKSRARTWSWIVGSSSSARSSIEGTGTGPCPAAVRPSTALGGCHLTGPRGCLGGTARVQQGDADSEPIIWSNRAGAAPHTPLEPVH